MSQAKAADETEQSTETPIAWIGGHTYLVVGDDDRIATVDLLRQEINEPETWNDGPETAHIDAVRDVIRNAPSFPTFEDRSTLATIELVQGAVDLLDRERRANPDQTQTAIPDESSDGSDDDEPESVFSAADVDDDRRAELLSKVDNWVDTRTMLPEYGQLDPELVDTDVRTASVPDADWAGEYAGREVVGVTIEMTEPWGTDYHDGNNWTNRDGWDDRRDALKDATSDADDILWFGEPDYVSFYPAGKVDDLSSPDGGSD